MLSPAAPAAGQALDYLVADPLIRNIDPGVGVTQAWFAALPDWHRGPHVTASTYFLHGGHKMANQLNARRNAANSSSSSSNTGGSGGNGGNGGNIADGPADVVGAPPPCGGVGLVEPQRSSGVPPLPSLAPQQRLPPQPQTPSPRQPPRQLTDELVGSQQAAPFTTALTSLQAQLTDAATLINRPSTCTPTPQDVADALEAERSPGRAATTGGERGQQRPQQQPRPLTFYLYEHGPYNFSATIRCVEEAVRMRPGDDDFDFRFNPSVAEHLTDLWALRAFQTHPSRVSSAAAADVKVLGVLPFLSWTAAKIGDEREATPCGTLAHHTARMETVAAALAAEPAYQLRNGRDFLVVNSHYRPEIQLSQALENVLQKGPAIVTTGEHSFMRKSGSLKTRAVTIPYKPNFVLERIANGDSGGGGAVGNPAAAIGANNSLRSRAVSHLFHGKLHQRGEGAKRTLLVGMAAQFWPDADINGLNLGSSERAPGHASAAAAALPAASSAAPSGPGGTARAEAAALAATTAQDTMWAQVSRSVNGMLGAKLCLCPEGNTPTTRRPFDALAAGCVPVFFSSMRSIAAELPFPNVVDWGSVAVFAGPLGCFEEANQVEAAAKWLQELATTKQDVIRAASVRGQQVFKTQLSYQSGAFVTSLLAELETRFDWPTAAP
jgi:hypothetical protein